MKKVSSYLIVMMVLLVLSVSSPGAAGVNWGIYDEFLKTHVTTGEIRGTTLSLVNYSAIKKDPRWSEILKQLAEVNLADLQTKQDKLAFYINAYNIFAIKMVVDHWPLESIRDVGSWIFPVWKKDVGILAGRQVTLHKIEHEILRKLDEPRIHFAIVCASVSCPDLLSEPYLAGKLDEQLEQQVVSFLNNEGKGLRVEGREIQVSKIFDWFDEDFESTGGIEQFVRQYKPGLPTGLQVEADIDYDWGVNSR